MKHLPIVLLPVLFGGTARGWRKKARRGDFGPITDAGKRRRFVDRATVEAKFGAISDEALANAVATFQSKHGLARHLDVEAAND